MHEGPADAGPFALVPDLQCRPAAITSRLLQIVDESLSSASFRSEARNLLLAIG